MNTPSPATLTAQAEDAARSRAGGAPYLILALELERPRALSVRYALSGVDAVVIGRGPGRAARIGVEGGVRVLRIEVPDPWMSATHARLERALGRWVLGDAGSKNGTFVNGAMIRHRELADDDLFEAGHTLFHFRDALVGPTDGPAVVDAGAGPPPPPGLATLVPALGAELARFRQVAASQVPVALEGDSGCGKEVLARTLHALSGRPGPFVAVNCGALPEQLVESELFGYRKGAFSGAVEDRPGLVRSADGGTLLLDEIGDLPGPAQAALLRVLQEEEVVPIGSTRPVKVAVRIAFATHRDLDALVEAGRFRGDLRARLDGFRLRLPPLRARREDLGLLVGTLLRRLAEPDRRLSLTREAAQRLWAHDWPFNVRELERCLARALALAGAEPIDVEHLPAAAVAAAPAPAPPRPRWSVAELERRERLAALLAEHHGNVSAVARALGKARQQVQRWLRRYGLGGR